MSDPTPEEIEKARKALVAMRDCRACLESAPGNLYCNLHMRSRPCGLCWESSREAQDCAPILEAVAHALHSHAAEAVNAALPVGLATKPIDNMCSDRHHPIYYSSDGWDEDLCPVCQERDRGEYEEAQAVEAATEGLRLLQERDQLKAEVEELKAATEECRKAFETQRSRAEQFAQIRARELREHGEAMAQEREAREKAEHTLRANRTANEAISDELAEQLLKAEAAFGSEREARERAEKERDKLLLDAASAGDVICSLEGQVVELERERDQLKAEVVQLKAEADHWRTTADSQATIFERIAEGIGIGAWHLEDAVVAMHSENAALRKRVEELEAKLSGADKAFALTRRTIGALRDQVNQARREGAEEMRERAARAAESTEVRTVHMSRGEPGQATYIRALPIDPPKAVEAHPFEPMERPSLACRRCLRFETGHAPKAIAEKAVVLTARGLEAVADRLENPVATEPLRELMAPEEKTPTPEQKEEKA